MSQGETYVTFDIDEDSNYFLAPSFHSVPTEHEEDDSNVDEAASKPTSKQTTICWKEYRSLINLTEFS